MRDENEAWILEKRLLQATADLCQIQTWDPAAAAQFYEILGLIRGIRYMLGEDDGGNVAKSETRGNLIIEILALAKQKGAWNLNPKPPEGR